jgi:hypothetical protein
MQVDKQPSPWPCVVMLAGLFLFCLAAPYYWQQDQPPTVATAVHTNPHQSQPSPELTWPNSHNDFANVPMTTFGASPNADLLSIWAPPTIEQLIAARTMNGAAYGWQPTTVRRGTVSNQAGSEYIADCFPLSSHAADALWFVGKMIAEYVPADLPRRLVAVSVGALPDNLFTNSRITPVYDSWQSPPASLRLVGPDDRLAMRPAPPRPNSWCVPQALYDQLQLLADHAYTAEWASHVSNQLHALTEREQLVGDDVQSILADLSDAAEEAFRMADSTDDPCLSVELLRAHWALARRIDRWVAMHEERVAYHFQGRVAARGDLSPYFSSAPSETPTPADVAALSNDLETYEKTGDPHLAARVVAQERVLANSPASFDRAFADAVEQHYRNANVRIALTAQIINRSVKSERSESRPVQDRIAGAFVRGQSDIFSQSRVELNPASDEWKLKVVTNGVVESNTLADGGKAQLMSHGDTDFYGSKSVIVRPDGVHMQESDVNANWHNQLVGVTTDYDWVPFFGGYARDRARQEYHARQNRVRTEMEARVSSETSDTLDQETHEAIERARKNIYGRFTDRFDQYGIKLTPIEMKSTPERLVARLRVAGSDQLGSHTPRPRALSDSLASFQLHETAMTNMAVTLGLDGQRLTGAELQKKMHEQFPKLALKDSQDIRRDTIFQFAPKNAVQVHVKDGRLELVIGFDNVQLDGNDMPNVTVHAYYTPSADGLNAELARDGALGIEGRFSASERAQLHNIFQTVLPPDRKLTIVHLGDQPDLHLDGLMITQLVLEDGWVGLAIGPGATNRVAERSRSLR